MESTKNATTLRLLHYPSIKEESDIKPGQIRCGEHTDYGSITLLFQDEMPGLEVFPLHFEQGGGNKILLVSHRDLKVSFSKTVQLIQAKTDDKRV